MLATAPPDDALLPFQSGGQGRRADPIEMGKVFVGGLSRETTTDGLRLYFERFGDISDCVVMKDRSTGAPRGFGFVTYASQVVASHVVHHRHVVDGKEVEAKIAVPRDSESLGPRPMGGGGNPMGMPGMGMPGMGMSGGPGHGHGPHGGMGGGMGPGQGGGNAPPFAGAANGGGGGGGGGEMASKKIFVGGLSHDTSESDFVGYFGARADSFPLSPSTLLRSFRVRGGACG